MKIESQSKTELLLNLVNEGKMDYSIFSKLQNLEFIVPFYPDKNADNRISYHFGNYISLAEYLNVKNFGFDDAKELLLLCARGFWRIREAGGNIANIMPDINYVFVEPVSRELKYIYLPVFLEINPDSFQKMIKQVLFVAKIENAEYLLGTALNALKKNREQENVLEIFIDALQNIDSNVNIVEKEVKVDRIIEKVIEKPVKQRTDLGGNLLFFTFVYTFTMILVPYVLCTKLGGDLISEPKLINISLCLLSILVTVFYSMKKEKERIDNKTVITMQPQERKK
ncbi:MAG: hypothetical protein IIT46_02065 [Lachnospiraceae bacterium]|nr:hypothetical protein [Lachnospiraceae bacterium]